MIYYIQTKLVDAEMGEIPIVLAAKERNGNYYNLVTGRIIRNGIAVKGYIRTLLVNRFGERML